jgi:hypothetical protein
VASKRTPLPHIAAHVPAGTKPASRGTRLARGVDNDTSTADGYFCPYAQVLLAPLALPTLGLVIEGRGVALMLHVVSQGRALPLAWVVRQGTPGHCPADRHIALVQQVHKRMPPGVPVVLRGDGTTFQHTAQAYDWSSVVRTGSHSTVMWDGERFRCETVAACSRPGPLVA